VKYGLRIWGLCDKFSGKWLGLWVLPNNWLGKAVAHCWLTTVKELGGKFISKNYISSSFDVLSGMPWQTTTGCGSELTVLHGLAGALR
jgi:hypothetical protein